jgi:hypothetical protein
MIPKLSAEQREALNDSPGPVAVWDEQTSRYYYLLDQATFVRMQQAAKLAAIRDGIADLKADRISTLDEVDQQVRSRFGSDCP